MDRTDAVSQARSPERADENRYPPREKPFHYSIHNRAFVGRVLRLQHANVNPLAGIVPWDLDKALKSAARRYEKFCGNTSKCVPHQGERERDRRRAQFGF